jgi:hypothetical protein
MAIERSARTEFISGLDKKDFAPGEVIKVPDVSLLGHVVDRIRDKSLAHYPEEVLDADCNPLPLEERFRAGRPEAFNGRFLNPTVTIEEPNPELIAKLPDLETVDPESIKQFTVTAEGHTTGYGGVGELSRQFVLLARNTEEGPKASLLSGKSSGTIFEGVEKATKDSSSKAHLIPRSGSTRFSPGRGAGIRKNE